MRTQGVWRARAAMAVAGLAMACPARLVAEAWEPPRIVKVTGDGLVLSLSWTGMAWATQASKDRPGAALAREGDLLWFLGRNKEERKEERNPFFLPYLAGDGASLALKVEEWRGFAGGKVVSLDLGEGGEKDEPSWAWLGKASREELAAVRFVVLQRAPPPARVPALWLLAEANPSLGLGFFERGPALDVLSLFKPRWLWLNNAVPGDLQPEKIPPACLKNVSYLRIEPSEAGSSALDLIAAIPNLRSLTLGGWEPAATGPLPRTCESVRTLTLEEFAEKSLAALAPLRGLQELHVVQADALEDIGGLAALPELKAATFSRCKNLSDLSPLDKLPGLVWLGLPPMVTPEQLAAAVRAHPDLRGLELLKCENIQDLTSLRGLSKLEVLVLADTKAGLAPLAGLKGLRLLVLPKETFEKTPEEVAKLEKELPQCQIVPGGGLCMGSGWILLLLPAAALARLALRRRTY